MKRAEEDIRTSVETRVLREEAQQLAALRNKEAKEAAKRWEAEGKELVPQESEKEKITTEASVPLTPKSGFSTMYDEPLEPRKGHEDEMADLNRRVTERFNIGTEIGSGSHASAASDVS